MTPHSYRKSRRHRNRKHSNVMTSRATMLGVKERRRARPRALLPTTLDPAAIGSRALARRLELGLDQAQIETLTGVSRAWISRVENRTPALQIPETWLRYARGLQMPLFELWFGTEPDVDAADAEAIDTALRDREFAVQFATVARDYTSGDDADRAWILATMGIINARKAAHTPRKS